MGAWIKKISSLGLAVKILGLTLAMVVLIVVVNNLVFIDKYRSSANKAMVAKAAASPP